MYKLSCVVKSQNDEGERRQKKRGTKEFETFLFSLIPIDSQWCIPSGSEGKIKKEGD